MSFLEAEQRVGVDEGLVVVSLDGGLPLSDQLRSVATIFGGLAAVTAFNEILLNRELYADMPVAPPDSKIVWVDRTGRVNRFGKAVWEVGPISHNSPWEIALIVTGSIGAISVSAHRFLNVYQHWLQARDERSQVALNVAAREHLQQQIEMRKSLLSVNDIHELVPLAEEASRVLPLISQVRVLIGDQVSEVRDGPDTDDSPAPH